MVIYSLPTSTSIFLFRVNITFIPLASLTPIGDTCCTSLEHDRSHKKFSKGSISMTMSLCILESGSTSANLFYCFLCPRVYNLRKYLYFCMVWDSSLFWSRLRHDIPLPYESFHYYNFILCSNVIYYYLFGCSCLIYSRIVPNTMCHPKISVA